MKLNKFSNLLLPVAMLGLAACAEADPGSSTDEVASELAGPTGTRAVYTMSNDAAGNSVVSFARASDGSLTSTGSTPTGGLGSGGGLGSQGALALSANGRILVVVNPGSNDVSSFAVTSSGLALRSRVSSGGERPISVDIHDGLVFVLNAGGTNNVSGLYLDWQGRLHSIAGSTQPLSAASVGPAQVAISPSGGAVVVTEKGTNTIDTFTVRYDGTLRAGVASPSAGRTPFGFQFTSSGQLVVSEAFGGDAGLGAVSSYRLGHAPGSYINRRAELITGPIADLQTAPCWIVVTENNRYAYTSNTGAGNISGYHVDHQGELTLFGDGGLTADTGTGSKPIDMALDRSSRNLYVLNAGTHEIVELDVAGDGSLVDTGRSVTVPDTTVGLVAR